MKTKKSSPGQISCLAFLGVFLFSVFFVAFMMLVTPLLPPILPWEDIRKTVTQILAYVAIGAAVITYFWAKSKQKGQE